MTELPKPASVPSFQQTLDLIDMGIICCLHCTRWYSLDAFYHEPLGKAVFEFYDAVDKTTVTVVHAGNICRACIKWFIEFSFPGPTVRIYRHATLTYYHVNNNYWKGRPITDSDYELEAKFGFRWAKEDHNKLFSDSSRCLESSGWSVKSI